MVRRCRERCPHLAGLCRRRVRDLVGDWHRAGLLGQGALVTASLRADQRPVQRPARPRYRPRDRLPIVLILHGSSSDTVSAHLAVYGQPEGLLCTGFTFIRAKQARRACIVHVASSHVAVWGAA